VTTYGSSLFVDHLPARTAEAVRLLEAAGYVDVGKTNLHEFAYGISSQNPHFGTVPNPRAPGRLAGGSSGGSAAAIAAGLAHVALGSDSGGSIRIPAAWCGIVGFKPSFELVPLDGCFPLAPSFDTAGPMASSVGDCVAMLQLLAPGFEPTSVDRGELQVGVAWLDEAAPLVREQVERAAALFPHRRSVDFPRPDGVDPIFMREAADVHRGLFPERADDYGDNVRGKLERCFAVTDAEVAEAQKTRTEYRERCAEAVAGLDLLLTPTIPVVAPPATVAEPEVRPTAVRCTFAFNTVGWPALAVPCGLAEDGLPASVQLAAPQGADALVLAAGAALERALPLG
jgi:aspartyl-tRNA(Asn)/glutamyl-tRNA(Gln) amidotransferase subunit A